MKSKLKLAIYEACENGVISVEDAQTYVNFVECADLDDADDVDVLTEMVDALADDGDAYYESAEEYVLDYLMEKAEQKEKSSLKDKLRKKKDTDTKQETKFARLKAKLAANKGKIAKGALAALGAGAAVGAGVAGYRNRGRIADAIRRRGRNGNGYGDDVDTSYVDAFGSTESVEALIYESVECGDISVTEAAELIELLAE